MEIVALDKVLHRYRFNTSGIINSILLEIPKYQVFEDLHFQVFVAHIDDITHITNMDLQRRAPSYQKVMKTVGHCSKHHLKLKQLLMT